MRFLADGNIPGEAVERLRAAGHDVVWVRSDTPGASDEDVLRRAAADSRVLLTFDKDFGEIALRAELPSACGIILFRIRMPPPAGIGAMIADIVSARGDWSGHFSVIEPGRIRMRPLPRGLTS